MKWQEILEREPHSALANALRGAEFGDLIDEEPEDGRINVYHSHWRDLELRVIDQDAIAWFGNGNCVPLAWALHHLTGLPLVMILIDSPAPRSPESQRWVHAAVRLPDGRLLDIWGVRDEVSVRQSWTRPNLTVTAWDVDLSDDDHRARFETLVSSSRPFQGMLTAYFSPVERAVIDDFAAHLLRVHHVPVRPSMPTATVTATS